MGAFWTVATESAAEFEALESEGQPSFSMTYGSSIAVAQAAAGWVEYDEEEPYFFTVRAENCAAVAGLFAHAATWQARQVGDLCRVAAALGRGVSAA